MESHLSRPPLPSLQGNRTWSFQRLALTRGAPGALSWTNDRDVGAACIHNRVVAHMRMVVTANSLANTASLQPGLLRKLITSSLHVSNTFLPVWLSQQKPGFAYCVCGNHPVPL